MAARLEFEAVLGTSGFGAGMTKLEATVAAANSRMAKYQAGIASEMARGGGIDSAINEAILIQNFKDAENAAASATKAIGFNRGAMQELLVIFREIGRGNWSRVPGSVTLFAQRLGLLEKAISTNAATGGIMLTTVGLLAGAIVAAGVAAYVTYRYFHGLAQAATDLNEALNGGKETLEKHDAAMMKSAEAAQAYRDWLKKLEEGHDSFSEAVMGAVKQMREEFEIRQKIASLNGQTNSQAQTARELQDQKELAVIERAKAQAEMDFKKAKDESAKSEKEAQDLAKRAQTAAEAAKETAKLADEEAKKSGLAAGALLFGLGLINPMLPGAKQAIDAAGSFDPAKAHSASAYDATQISALAKAAADKAADDKRKAE